MVLSILKCMTMLSSLKQVFQRFGQFSGKLSQCAHEFMAIFEDFNAQWNTDTMENHDYRGRDRRSFNLLRITCLED